MPILPTDAPVVHTQTEDRLFTLYRTAGDLEVALEGAMRSDPATPLTAAQTVVFNNALEEARDLLPQSRVLREDLDALPDGADAAHVYRLLHLALVPTLHNALPDDYATR